MQGSPVGWLYGTDIHRRSFGGLVAKLCLTLATP